MLIEIYVFDVVDYISDIYTDGLLVSMSHIILVAGGKLVSDSIQAHPNSEQTNRQPNIPHVIIVASAYNVLISASSISP